MSYGLTHKLSGEHIDMHSLKETYSGFQVMESGRIIKEADVDRIMFSKGLTLPSFSASHNQGH